MKHHVHTFACGAALLAVMAMALVACGGRETMASRSAAAYDEAKKEGVPIAAGEHGGHTAEPGAQATADTGHAAMDGMDHSQMSGMDHSTMPGMQHGASGTAAHDMAGMDHSKMPGMQHGKQGASTPDMTGMDHSSMPGMDHAQMAAMQHGTMPGMQHGAVTATAMPAPSASNAAIAQTQPAATLRADEFDAPSPLAVDEAAKAAAGMTHSMEDAAPKAQEPAHPPKPPSEHHHDHDTGAAS